MEVDLTLQQRSDITLLIDGGEGVEAVKRADQLGFIDGKYIYSDLVIVIKYLEDFF